MANKLALGLVIGGAVSSTVGAAFKDVSNKIKKLEEQGSRARVLQKTIGETMRLREEWLKAHMAGEKGADALRRKLENNLDGLRKQGVEVRNLTKAYAAMGQAATKAELKAKGHMQLDAGKQQLKSSIGQAAAATAAMAVPTKVSADYGAIIRDIAIKANIANTPEEAQMSKTIIGTSRDTGMARNQVAEVVNALVGAGMELDKAMSYAPVAAKFAIGQGSDGGETARMINALGQNAKISDPAVMQKALEAIAYQGQAGSFEAADMARWFPELLAGMGKIGITGMDAVTQLGSMLQVQMKTAGGADEAANNLKNWMEKIGSGDTLKAYKDAGIDYQGSMNTGLQNGKSTLESSFELAQKYIAATDPKKAAAMAAATAKISKETDPAKAKAMIASLEQALRTGDLFADMQVKGALTAYMQNKELYAQLKKDSASATGILDKNLEERRQASAQKWAEMAQGMDDAMRAIGDAFRPVTDKVADGLAYVTQGLAKLSDESPRVVTGIGAAVAAVIAFQTAMSGFKIAKGLLNLGRGSLMGNPNIPQKVIVTNMPMGGPGGMDLGGVDDAGGKDGKGKGRGGGRGRSPGRGVGAGLKGPAVLAVIEAGFKVKDTYDNAETQDEKAEGYGAAAGGLAGTLAGAAAGAAIGSAVPVIGTILGGLIGGYLGSLGGDALGGAIGKSMFGSDESKKAMPVAGPLMMKDAGKDIPPVLGDIAKSFTPSRTGPLMLTNPGQGALPATPGTVNPGDAARSMMLPQASADAVAAPLAAAVVAKVQPAKIEPKVDIHAPITLTVQGDVKDPNEILAQLRPLMEQQQREIAQQLESRKLYDAPNI
ncbi:phage tail tape measure protein [Pseudomonas extremorientalis]|uniref:Phage tail tape measure protein n=1 Tax=Pseudomonas extremorientalis TaxID=169669 RepID=A0A1H0KUY4_9PSED|nr:phage tail tape measure protein [Pseudomonas extremorientalis]KAB0517547.1 phage tail tape measure protein [Pseudomonas extremorientalis]OIN05027.1 phage tail tape measure protein [Pseudomonas extremorientalis]SDO59675.1 Phage tail tape-measure protein, controls tail length [Pseudomonas extremorientalis]